MTRAMITWLSAMLLSMPAMVSTTTQDIIQQALENVPTNAIAEWSRKVLGQSTQSQRMHAFRTS